MTILFFIISFLASTVGAICGIGGGVIIKPVLDMFGVATVATISFLSGCTVLSMSCYSVTRSITAKDSKINMKLATPIAIGAVIGGISGSYLFSYIKDLFDSPNTVGAVQGGCLALVTIMCIIATLNKHKMHTKNITSPLACAVVGLVLGLVSSFLGIGGGPINLVVLFYFFSMDTKTAAQNSLYIILLSQASSLASTIITGSVPAFDPIALVLMVAGGILGGIVGRIANKRISEQFVSKLFIALMFIIVAICCYNVVQYI